MNSELTAAIESIEAAIAQIRASGSVAQKSTVIEVAPHAKTGKRYARKRNGNRFEGCGREGSDKHKAAIESVQRRAAIEELKQIAERLELLQVSEGWQAIAPSPVVPLELNQTEYVEPGAA